MFKLPVVVAILFLFSLTPARAHVQGGPPYLLVDGEYADTTPLISSSPSITVAQDVTKKSFLVNEPVSFKVDLAKLSVPPTIAQASKWRWKWNLSDTNFEEGVELSHIFSNTGSYLVSLQVKDPTSQNYLDYDLIQVNIVPRSGYILPTAQISAKISRDSGNQEVSFTASSTTDPSSSIKTYTWDFGDGTTEQGQMVRRSYAHNISSVFPLLRVTDANGLFTDSAIEITSDDKINQLGSTYSTTPKANSPSTSPNWLIIGGVGLAMISIILRLFKKFRS